jgi:hypothetical protein
MFAETSWGRWADHSIGLTAAVPWDLPGWSPGRSRRRGRHPPPIADDEGLFDAWSPVGGADGRMT